MNYFIMWMRPEVLHYHKSFSDGDECAFLMVPYFQVFEGSVPLNCFDVPIYTTAN